MLCILGYQGSIGMVKRSKSTVIREVSRRRCQAATTMTTTKRVGGCPPTDRKETNRRRRRRRECVSPATKDFTSQRLFLRRRPLERRRFTSAQDKRQTRADYRTCHSKNEGFPSAPPFRGSVLLLLMGTMRQFVIPRHL